jgi:hypothetical protein
VNNKCDINISSHVPVSASLNINWNGKQRVKKSNQTTYLGCYRPFQLMFNEADTGT